LAISLSFSTILATFLRMSVCVFRLYRLVFWQIFFVPERNMKKNYFGDRMEPFLTDQRQTKI